MNILFISAVLPYPLHSGGQTRIYNILRRLSKKHRITLVSYIRSDAEKKYARELAFCDHVHMVYRGSAWRAGYILRALACGYPFLLATYDNPRMRTLVSGLMDKTRFDVIHLEPFYVWPALPATNVPIVVSEHNIEYAVYERYAGAFRIALLKPVLARDVQKLLYWERLVWRNASALTAVSETDARVMEQYLSREVAVVPNGVDPKTFPFRNQDKTARMRALFVGNFRWLPNRQAANELVRVIWPGIIQRFPKATLTVAGRDIPDAVRRRFTQQGIIVKPNVSVITGMYHDADVLIAPHTIAGGTKYKMLEAMSCGLPVVTTPQGVAGLGVSDRVHYLEAVTPKEFADAAALLWENRAVSSRIAANARTFVEKQYGWDAISPRLDRVWRKTR